MTTAKGPCTVCLQIRWISSGTARCKPCGYLVGICVQCSHSGKIYVDGLCYCCYQHRQVKKKMVALEKNFTPKSDYNGDLFKLYVTYIKRYRLSYFHLCQTKKLIAILEQDPWPPVRSWDDIFKLSARYKLNHSNRKENGCAVKKIGFMLEELGILRTRDEDFSTATSKALRTFEGQDQKNILAYKAWMEKSGRAEQTVYNNVRYLQRYLQWINIVYPGMGFTVGASRSKITEHLTYLTNKGYRPSHMRYSLLALRRFYEWLVRHQVILDNPCTLVKVAVMPPKINIVSPSDYRKLVSYIKAESSPSEEALAIFLFLFYGLRTEDILHACVEVDGEGDFTIIFRQSPRSYGCHYYNREQILRLPNSPPWLEQLKKRFLKDWRAAYAKSKQTYPTQRLILPRHHMHTRVMNQMTLIKRIYAATKQATGSSIPPTILRQTCGHTYVQNGDGSVLTTMGWSPVSAFHYTWRPREIVSPSDLSTET